MKTRCFFNPVCAQKNGRMKEYAAMKADHKSYIDNAHFESNRPALAKITPFCAPFGSAEVYACKIGRQKSCSSVCQTHGRCRVTGGLENRMAGGYTVNKWGEHVPNDFALQGEVFTAYPNSVSLATWAAHIEASVPNPAKRLDELQKALARFGK